MMEREGGKEEGGGREGGRRREGRKEEVVGGEREREGGRREGWEGKGREGEKGVKTYSQHTVHIVTISIPQTHSHHMWGWVDASLLV